ncbi:restriction endonuclease [Variovorax sp. RO1]|nr:restriction endonuclease [Variovorax sp. RO1]
MLLSPVHPLGEVAKFAGAGIYAIYYVGDFPAYEPIAIRNRDGKFDAPLYVGKAVPEGSRQGKNITSQDETTALRSRLSEHAASIRAVQREATDGVAPSLKLEDFFCRYLIVDDVWIPLGESLLVAKFNPLWNQFLDGFGNHTPGSGREKGVRPRWDTLHPGRLWAKRLPPRQESSDEILRDVANHLRSVSFPGTAHVLQPANQAGEQA